MDASQNSQSTFEHTNERGDKAAHGTTHTRAEALVLVPDLVILFNPHLSAIRRNRSHGNISGGVPGRVSRGACAAVRFGIRPGDIVRQLGSTCLFLSHGGLRGSALLKLEGHCFLGRWRRCGGSVPAHREGRVAPRRQKGAQRPGVWRGSQPLLCLSPPVADGGTWGAPGLCGPVS